jgi:DNA-binding response OmpR family regulator
MPARQRRRAVLLVEDDRVLQGALARFLELNGFAVIAAATADEALAAWRTREVDGAIVDLHLGQGSGRDVVVSIPQPVPVIIFSGAPEESGQLERLRPRTRLVPKPHSLVLLIDTLKGMLVPQPAPAASAVGCPPGR